MLLNFSEFFDFISKTGDSYIKGYQISNGIVIINLILDDNSEIIIELESNYFFIDKLSEIQLENTGFFQCIKISDYLEIENGFYISKTSFSELMKLRKLKLTLAIGNLAKDFDYIINYYGYKNIISFLINSNKLVKVEEV